MSGRCASGDNHRPVIGDNVATLAAHRLGAPDAAGTQLRGAHQRRKEAAPPATSTSAREQPRKPTGLPRVRNSTQRLPRLSNTTQRLPRTCCRQCPKGFGAVPTGAERRRPHRQPHHAPVSSTENLLLRPMQPLAEGQQPRAHRSRRACSFCLRRRKAAPGLATQQWRRGRPRSRD